MPSSRFFRIGHFSMGFHYWSKEIIPEIDQMISSISFGVDAKLSDAIVHLVLIESDITEDSISSFELPERGKEILLNVKRAIESLSSDNGSDEISLFVLAKIVDLGSRDWFSPELKMFFFHDQDGLLFCYSLIFDKKIRSDLIQNRITNYILFLATYWYALNQGLILHSAAVAYGKKGYLFLGQGGAGKSTASTIGAENGLSVLSDDLSFVKINIITNRYEQAASPGPISRYSTAPLLQPNLCGIYRLIQDTQDYLTPLSEFEIAHLLFRSFQWSQWVARLPKPIISQAFYTSCDIARKVSGYELHFRKSPDFLSLIIAPSDEKNKNDQRRNISLGTNP